jgi:hypothetical protein
MRSEIKLNLVRFHSQQQNSNSLKTTKLQTLGRGVDFCSQHREEFDANGLPDATTKCAWVTP